MPKHPISAATYARAARVYRAASAQYRAAERCIPRRDRALRDMLIMRAAACAQYADAMDDQSTVQRVTITPRVYTRHVRTLPPIPSRRRLSPPAALMWAGVVIIVGTALAMWGIL